tara:strand:- start:7472 stop:7750 length:279 start_codon:yes stop_codon:yes gene_type:complete
MTISDERPRDWKEDLVDWVGSQWRWILVGIVLLFAFNRLAGLAAGLMGLIALVNRIVGRAMKMRKVVEQVQQIVTEPDDLREKSKDYKISTD